MKKKEYRISEHDLVEIVARVGTLTASRKESAVVSLEPLAVRRQTAAHMLEIGLTKLWELTRTGKLQTVKVGADDRIVVDSIRRFIGEGAARDIDRP